ncbi:SCAN domain-containing protein 3-like [Scylla paramamosain]|uniref:SCAN domain-containing protein 3-like n=1 Tax=Scylla paramamosain TaxID=85552 RepID=UPI0030834FAC
MSQGPVDNLLAACTNTVPRALLNPTTSHHVIYILYATDETSDCIDILADSAPRISVGAALYNSVVESNNANDNAGTVMASNKKRNYDDNYLDFGFTSITDKGVVKPQCVICHKILTAESLRPSKLRLHLETKHPQHVGKDRSFFSRQELNMKRQRLDASGFFNQQNAAIVEASFLVSLEIAKKKKPHTIEEELILPCAKTMKLTEFFESEGLDWGNLCGICTDGAPTMLGSQSGFVTRVIQKAPYAIPLHCMIHRQALASKTLPSELQDTLNAIIKTVNFVKGSALNTPLFKRLCQDVDAAHETLLFHKAVRWLSRGNVVQRVFELREEISLFLRIQNKQDLLSAWSADSFEIRLAYLVDMLRQLNTLNLELQGKGSLIIDFVDKIKAFIRKMENWRSKVGMGTLAMLDTVSEIVEECEAATQNLITQHLEALEGEFKRYFPDIQSLTSRLVRAPFTAPVTCIPDDNDDGQTELLTLQEDSRAKMKFETESLTVFWSSVAASYPNLCDLAFRHLLPFSSTYSCEAAFSQLLHIKTKYRNRLEVKHDLRCALSETKPRIKKLVDNLQHHPSH